MAVVRLACEAMATRFELALQGSDAVYLRAAGEEALAEIRRLEARLSFYRATSDVGRINAGAAERPVRVESTTFELLSRAAQLHAETRGAFDVTVGPLVRCWRAAAKGGTLPEPAALAAARERVGMHHLELEARDRTVRFARPGMLVDLGAIGKGYALERAARILRELGVESALLHGGTSSVQALGRPLTGGAWRVALEYPGAPAESGAEQVIAVVELGEEALSVSAVWGRAFSVGGRIYGHVLDPRAGAPVTGASLAAAVADSATDADALATALLTLGTAEYGVVAAARPHLPLLVLAPGGPAGAFHYVARGIAVRPSPRLVAASAS